MPKFILNADLLCAVASCISTEEIRPHLRGVYVVAHGDGALMVATDGHRMALGYDDTGTADAPAILALDWSAKVLKSTRSEDRKLFVDGTFGTVRNGADPDAPPLGVLQVDHVDGTFPDWTRALPATGDPVATTNGFDGNYLASFAKAVKRAGLTSGTGLRITQAGEGEPAWVRTQDHRLAFILMPMRWLDADSGKPGWLDSGFFREPAASAAE